MLSQRRTPVPGGTVLFITTTPSLLPFCLDTITGTVFKVETSQGSAVAEGDVLVILESMKMEMPIEAPISGTVTEVRVEEGQSVDEGQVLVVLD